MFIKIKISSLKLKFTKIELKQLLSGGVNALQYAVLLSWGISGLLQNSELQNTLNI